MGDIGEYRVSRRGQMSLPAAARKRWGIEDGGVVEVIDTGSSLVVLPGGRGAAWAMLSDAVEAAGGYAELARRVAEEDPDLA